MTNELAWCGQKLAEHLRNVATLILNPREYSGKVNTAEVSKEIGTVAVRLSRVMGIDTETIRRYMALAGYLHDIGKAHPHYQEVLAKQCGVNEDKISLAGHEVLSAWITWHIMHNLMSDEEAAPFVVGVLLHHSGRRSVDDAYYSLRRYIHDPGQLLPRLRQYIEDAVITVDVDLDVDKVMAELKYYFNAAINPIENVILVRTLNSRYAKYGELITYVIALADNIDSFLNRSGNFIPIVIRKFLASSP